MPALPPFIVTAHWDAEAKVWVSESDIRGLVIEAGTLDEFEALVFALAPEMIRDNHPGEGAGPVRSRSEHTTPLPASPRT